MPVDLNKPAEGFTGARCLVTGGLGFIGSNVARVLDAAGAEVTVVDSLEPRHGGDLRNVEGTGVDVIVADIAAAAAVSEPLAGADYVFNLAGQVSHLDSMTHPVADLDINARSQLAFLEHVRRVNPGASLVYASTRQIYGRPQTTPVDESHPIEPIDVNGVSKLAADQLHRLYHRVYMLPISVLRLSNVYGPLQRLDGDHQGFLPSFVRRAVDDEPITVFGDGSQQRDCLYVEDAVAALLAAARTPAAYGEAFNIGHHQHASLLEIAEAVVEVAGSGDVVCAPWPEDRARIAIPSFWTDHTKATRVLGWKPRWSLGDGLVPTIRHARTGEAART